MPVALYMMFSEADAPTAKLPINIPKLDDSCSFTDEILYARGFGLTYASKQEPTTEPTTAVPDTTFASEEAVTTVPAASPTDATSSTQKPTSANQTSDGGNGTVQTGADSILIVFVILLIVLSALFMMRFAKGREE